MRNTGVAIDQSGNVWLANNWLTVPVQTNPGGHEVVAYLGLAAPISVPAPDLPAPTPSPDPTHTPLPEPTPELAASGSVESSSLAWLSIAAGIVLTAGLLSVVHAVRVRRRRD